MSWDKQQIFGMFFQSTKFLVCIHPNRRFIHSYKCIKLNIFKTLVEMDIKTSVTAIYF